jgi:hypothetical protein
MGLATLDTSSLTWAAKAVIWAAENPQTDGMSYSGSMFSVGADRAAAASAPLFLLAPFDNLDLARSQVENCLDSSRRVPSTRYARSTSKAASRFGSPYAKSTNVRTNVVGTDRRGTLQQRA